MFCQLEFLRRSLPSRIPQALVELPESLDGTYERTLQDINEANREFAHRIFQCVAVASRPLYVKELAEFLAFDFNAGVTPTFHPRWRPVDPLDALLSTCSSLLAVVIAEGSEVVQFSHFSVKEFLTSTRLAKTTDAISRYHVSMTPAHTLVAQACLGLLLHLDGSISRNSLNDFPLAEYAAEHWMDHARFKNVLTKTQDGMKRLFDPRMRHLAIWFWIFDPDAPQRRQNRSTHPSQPRESCLHYAALFGFHDLFAFLVIERAEDVNAKSLDDGQTPLHTTLRGGHVEFARLLIQHGADVSAQDNCKWTPLHFASEGGHVQLAWLLIGHGADVNAQNDDKCTPLHLASNGGHVELFQVLFERGADVNARNNYQWTPLHLTSKSGHVEFARALVEHGANVNAQGHHKSTPLHLACKGRHVELALVLVEHGADANAQADDKSAPLHLALRSGHVEFARVLIEHGADVNVQELGSTPLHLALKGGNSEIALVLLEHGAQVNVKDNNNLTPLHLVSMCGHAEFAQLLLRYDADANVQGGHNSTPLHLAVKYGHLEVAQVLLMHGASANARDIFGFTPLQRSRVGISDGMIDLLLQHVIVNHGTL